MTLSYDQFRTAFDGRELPLAWVDLDSLDRNISTTLRRAGEKPIRVASKSVRSVGILERILDGHDRIRGLMSFTGLEARFLAEQGFDDILVAYPVVHEPELRDVARAVDEGAHIILTVDDADQVDRTSAIAREVGVTVSLCLDIDMSSTFPGIHFGVRRSDIRTPEAALELAGVIDDAAGVELAGVLGYEAQIAGLPDQNPAKNVVVNAFIRLLKRRSSREVLERRGAVVDRLEDAGYDLAFVNGGGTGSLELTKRDDAVTEVTAGSAFYSPALFDYYDAFQHEPAAGYAIEVVRRPAPGIYTCRGGGYPASGPTEEDKSPVPYLPAGARLLDAEGAGEVQTPVRYDGTLDLGDPVVMRHAKAGELCERFQTLTLLSEGRVVGETATYRGEGKCFL